MRYMATHIKDLPDIIEPGFRSIASASTMSDLFELMIHSKEGRRAFLDPTGDGRVVVDTGERIRLLTPEESSDWNRVTATRIAVGIAPVMPNGLEGICYLTKSEMGFDVRQWIPIRLPHLVTACVEYQLTDDETALIDLPVADVRHMLTMAGYRIQKEGAR